MNKLIKYGTLVLALVLVAAIASSLIIGRNKNRIAEDFSDVRAYRTEVSTEDFIDDEEIPGNPFTSPLREDLRNMTADAFFILNDTRIEQNLEPLAWSSELEYYARIRAEEISCMFDKKHVRPNGAAWFTIRASVVLGENIYKGKGNAQEAMASWIPNITDNENFLCTEFTRCAIAVYESDDGEYYWVALFSAE